MSDRCQTMRVKPWGKDQGDFVEINAADFDPKFHVAFDSKTAPLTVDVEIEVGAPAISVKVTPAKAPAKRAKRKGK